MTSLTMRGAVAALSSQHTQPGATTAHSTSLPLSRPFSLSLSSLSHSGSASSTRPLVPVASRRPLLAAALAEGGAAATEEGAAGFEEEVEYVGNDELLLYFKAEGSLSEAAIPRVTKALEACDGVDNVRVTFLEGCATVECTKTTTVQAAAVSSSLVEALQGAGFALQSINLGFNDDGSETAAELFSVYGAEGNDVLPDFTPGDRD